MASTLEFASPIPGAPPPTPRLEAGKLLILAGTWLAIAGGAWSLAGTAFWQAFAFWGGVLSIGNVLWGVVNDRFRRCPPPISLYLSGVWLSWYLIGAQFALGYIYVDNFSPHGVTIRLDGRDWIMLDAKATTECRLRKGSYEVSIWSLDGHQELDHFEINVWSQYGLLTSYTNNYVLNVLGAGTYRRGDLVYSDRPEMWPSGLETQIRDKWFKVDTDYVFEDPPRFGRGGATVTYLRRGQATER